MRFLQTNMRFRTVLVVLLQLWPICRALDDLGTSANTKANANTDANASSNNITFIFKDIEECRRNEYYDLDIFECVACSTSNAKNLQSTADKFSCECTSSSIPIALYDTLTKRSICAQRCLSAAENVGSSNTECALETSATNATTTPCTFKLINSTTPSNTLNALKTIRITEASSLENCHDCDLTYNFRYHDYCIVNALLKPYLKYNSFWQSTAVGGAHSGELKFVAFFCLTLHNATACNQLANLCVLSHYSADKHSPCSAFLLTQVSDVAIKYASMDEHLQATRPFLYFRKGKETAEMLATPVARAAVTLQNRLQLFGIVYALDGTLQRWGALRYRDINLCQMHVLDELLDELVVQRELLFTRYIKARSCNLTLAALIHLAQVYTQNTSSFISVFLNVSDDSGGAKTRLHTVPILIEDITPENAREQPAEWQLVKRFQLIDAQPRHIGHTYQPPAYRDEHKLLLYRSIRYVEHINIRYEIDANNRIGVPLLKLRYRHILINANATLDSTYPFALEITYRRVGPIVQRHILYELVLPALLLAALLLALLRTYGQRKRRATAVAAQAQTQTSSAAEWCGVSCCLGQFLLQLISYAANALLLCFLLYMIIYPLDYLLQREVRLTLPLVRSDAGALSMLIYAAFLLKFAYLCVHLWRISHLDLFLIDWERPRSYENNHFTLKSCNPETSSVCSSVRTFASENNVSAWRVFFAVNEWIHLSVKQQHSTMLQGVIVLIIAQYFIKKPFLYDDLALSLFVIILCSIVVYTAQRLCQALLLKRLFGDPLQKFVNLCSLSNVSVFMLLERSYGFYIHGRSPNGFADTDMYSMLVQLQRDSQNRCSRKGLLGDSDQQSYIILPPMNFRAYCEKFLAPLQRSYSISQAHFQKEINSIDATVERSSVANSSLNRFLCAFIDHAFKDMDYIIKEKTFLEKLFNCEFDNNLTENKGTFYIDNAQTFSQLFLYGNDLNIFIMELMLLLAIYMLTTNLLIATVVVCLLNKLLKCIFHKWVYQNVAMKTSIDRRFLM